MINAGKYNKRIDIYAVTYVKDSHGFQSAQRQKVLTTYAEVKTTSGMTLISQNTDFEKAFTRFVIRFPVTPLNRDMQIDFNGKTYVIEYINNVNEANVEVELQCREITH